jgi:hypothetical protein
VQWGGGGLPAHPQDDPVYFGPAFRPPPPGLAVSGDMKLLACKRPTTTSTFYVDSGAGQCLSSCSAAFITLEPCHIEVIGIAGSSPIFGIGTAVFALSVNGEEVLVRIHNCLYSFGEFNLLSVSQMQTIQQNSLDLSLPAPSIRLSSTLGSGATKGGTRFLDFPLKMDDGLYALIMEPISSEDPRHLTSEVFDVTSPDDYIPLTHKSVQTDGKSKLTRQIWTTMVVPSASPQGRIFTLAASLDFHSELLALSDRFLAPAAIPPSRRQFDVSSAKDMSDLSIRFLGGGTDRILRTVSISNGLSEPPSKKHARVPPLNFPQGNMKKFKTPRVSKDLVGHLHTAEIAEVLYTDTIYTGDRKFPYAQVFVDRVSRYGDVIPLKSRTEIGAALVTFVCRHYTPLILISDNIAENHGGDLVEQCRKRDIKQLFTCPYHPQMDFAEGYIGRITTMASFAMVYSGAPLFMWVWGVKTAVFIDHIMAAYYSAQKVWATPYELVHGEPFPDASIIVPFGCGVLVLLTKTDRAKFKSRCALMIFVHYADDHPLYTYAVYSPLTRKVLMRQDCIFLPTLFPMRAARASAGLDPEGEPLVPFRSPERIRAGEDPDLSFQGWTDQDPLPEYEDHVLGPSLRRPKDCEVTEAENQRVSLEIPSYHPSHPSFGGTSGVAVMAPPKMGRVDHTRKDIPNTQTPSMEIAITEMSGSTSGSVPKASTQPISSTQPMTLTFADAYRGHTGPVDFRFLPMPPAEHQMFRFDGDRGISFTIKLRFTGFERPNQYYRVFENLTVRILHYRIAIQILRVDPRGIRMFVQDQRLFHRGTISDRFDPDHPAVQTPYLVRNSVLEIRLVPIGDFGPAPRSVNFWGYPIPNSDDTANVGESLESSLPDIEATPTDMAGEDIDPELIAIAAPPVPGRTILVPPVRASSRARAQRESTSLDRVVNVPTRHRPVGDRWYYASGGPDETKSGEPRNLVLSSMGSSSVEEPEQSELPLTRTQSNQLIKQFDQEGRNRRNLFKAKIKQVWTSRAHPQPLTDEKGETPLADSTEVQISPDRDSESVDGFADSLVDVNFALDNFLARRLGTGGLLDINVVFDEFMFLQLGRFDETLQANKHLFLAEIYRRVNGRMESLGGGLVSDELLQQRTAALWSGLRRVYFHQVEPEPDVDSQESSPLLPRKRPRVPDDLNTSEPRHPPPDDSDDPPSELFLTSNTQPVQPDDDFDSPRTGGSSNGEDIEDCGSKDVGGTKKVGWSPHVEDLTELSESLSLGEKIP